MSDETDQRTGEIIPLKPSDLAVQITDNAVNQLRVQRNDLRQFIKTQLKKDVDYGTIPGTPKPTLYKPGAEKLASLFKLGSRIVSKERTIDHDKSFAMFSYTIEVFYLPTGQSISQCEGSANSKEKKYASRPMADQLNTLQKMAQKRAYVGAMIIAVGASDYFTQDLEDMPRETFQKTSLSKEKKIQQSDELDTAIDNSNPDKPFVFTFGKFRGRNIMEIPSKELVGYLDYLKKIIDPGPMIVEAISMIQITLQDALMTGKQ